MRTFDPQIKYRLQELMDAKAISYAHMYPPARNSIKVIFPTEKDLDKVINQAVYFITNHFEPKISLKLKANRTVFCTNLDPSILGQYTKEDIKEELTEQGWKVKEIFIMQSKKSFKIEMMEQKQAKEFIKNSNTSIGHIQLKDDNKEQETDPTINQCWECGQLNPDHNSRDCTGTKICLKCGDNSHKFFDCSIPKEVNKMSELQKAARFCAACRKKTDHTSLDHRYCPKKREIIRERARLARESKLEEQNKHKKETELIKKVLDLTDKKEWPALTISNTQQTQVITIVTCALLDEATNPGVFSRKLEEGCTLNHIPPIKYRLEANTAQNFLSAIAGAKMQQSYKPIQGTLIQPPSASSTPRSRAKRTETKRIMDQDPIEQENLNHAFLVQEEKKQRQNRQRAHKQLFQATTYQHNLLESTELVQPNNQATPNKDTTQQLKEIRTGRATTEDFKILQQNLENNPLIIKTMGKQVETKEKITTLDKLSIILNNVEIFSNPEWIEEIREATKLLISAGFSKKEIKIKYKQEPETQEQLNKSPGRFGELLVNTCFYQNDLEMDSNKIVKLD